MTESNQQSPQILRPSEVIQIAKKYIKEELYPDEKLDDLRLEELELADDKKAWFVTLGFYRHRRVELKNAPSIVSMTPWTQGQEVEHRVYKRLKMDAVSGDFLGMDMVYR